MLADDDVRDMLVGDAGKGDQSLPTAPAGRHRRLRAEDIANAALYALEQPPSVDVNEIIIRPTGQEK